MKNCFKLIDETAKQLPMNTAAAAVFNRVALLDALKRVAPATCRKSSVLPILQNVLFNVQKDGSAIITATNCRFRCRWRPRPAGTYSLQYRLRRC